MRHRQSQQIQELIGFASYGIGAELHPDRQLYGSGWGDPDSVPHLMRVRDRLKERLDAVSLDEWVIEIGCGGGRWSRQIARHKAAGAGYRLGVIDGHCAALSLTHDTLRREGLLPPDVALVSEDGRFGLDGTAAVVFSFDVFVHFDRELIRNYLESVARVLKPGGAFHVSFACEFPGHPEWIRSDEWFEYVMQDRSFCDELAAVIDRHFTFDSSQILEMPGGYGSAFVELTRR